MTTCWYDTRRKTNATVGGFTFEDEMCLNYIHYYPRTEDLEICKSSVDPDALDTYFQFLNEFRFDCLNLIINFDLLCKNAHFPVIFNVG